jgi:site-specific DNA-methyltransferase (adenine-specific)
VLRVLKPGAYLVAFGGTRTWHRIACAIEDAGFEIRDNLAWLYGQGFPKSLDLSKALDRVLTGSAAMSTAEKGGTYASNTDSRGRSLEVPVTAAATDLAKKWVGFGTSLKPSFEPVILARKPPIGTIASNVEAYGVGGLHIDACRTPLDAGANLNAKQRSQTQQAGHTVTLNIPGHEQSTFNPEGRWPPNVLCDEEVAADLDERYGFHGTSGSAKTGRKGKTNRTGVVIPGFGAENGNLPNDGGGGVSRYFYCPKANARERDAGLEVWPVLSGGDATDREDGSAGVNNPRAGAGRGGGRRNPHPTVKPLELMRWLVRLVTPPGGFVLDPFAGSGTTGCACALEGFHFGGVELDEVHSRLAMDRIAYWASQRAA